eukprot:g43545.t1
MQGHNTVQVGSAATGMTQPAEPRPSKHRTAMSAPGNLAKNANLTRRKRIKARFSMKKESPPAASSSSTTTNTRFRLHNIKQHSAAPNSTSTRRSSINGCSNVDGVAKKTGQR